MSMQHISLVEARTSGRIVEKKISGVTYTYAGRCNSWIDGHEWASLSECEDRTVGSKQRLGTRSWIVAQLYWWGLWPSDLVAPRSAKKADLAYTLHRHVMQPRILEIHPKDVWASLGAEWNEKFAPLSPPSTSGDENSEKSSLSPSPPVRRSKRLFLDAEEATENGRERIVKHIRGGTASSVVSVASEDQVDRAIAAVMDDRYYKALEDENEKLREELITSKRVNQGLRKQLKQISQISALHRRFEESSPVRDLDEQG